MDDLSKKRNSRDKIFIPIIIFLSILVPVLVTILIYLPNRVNLIGQQINSLPFFHALINGTTAVLLLLGYIALTKNNIRGHRYCMVLSFLLSIIFLVSYVISKLGNDPTPYGGEDGVLRYIYFFILISHIILAIVIVPLALLSIYRAMNNQIAKHKKIAKWTLPIWLYVSITGVLVYLMMAPYYV